jgi:hypothetical protein
MPKIQAEDLGGNLLRKTLAENFCWKLLRKTAAENFCGNMLRNVKFMRLIIYDRTKADNFRAYQNLCGKVLPPLTIWARQNLQLLTSSRSGWRALVQILVDSVASRTCRPQVIWRLRPLCFYGLRLSGTVPACCTGMTCQNFCGCPNLCAAEIFTISCEKSKILSRLLSVLSLYRKFVHDHFCCPNSATILTSS